MAIFHHPFTDIKKIYPIVSLLSLIISFNTLTKDHPHNKGKGKKMYSLRIMNVQMPDVEREMKLQKMLSSLHEKIEMRKIKAKMLKKEPK